MQHSWEPDASSMPGYQAAEVHYIPLNRLKTIYQSDEATDEAKVMENVRKMKEGRPLPPVIIGTDYDVQDGHHKIKAAERMGYTHAPCCVGCSDEDAKCAADEHYRDKWGLQKSWLDNDLTPIEDAELLEKSMAKTKKMYPELTGGAWKTIRGHHVYIKGGKIVAGGIPGVTSKGEKVVKKMPKTVMAEHNKALKEKEKKAKAKLDKDAKSANTKGTTPKGVKTDGKPTGQSNGGQNSPSGKGTPGAMGQGGQDAGGNRSVDSSVPVKKTANAEHPDFSVKGAKVVNHIPEHGMYEVKGHKAFHKAISDAKAAHADGHGAMVHAYEPDEYKDKRLFMNKDGTHGFALSKDGDIVSVFKHPTKGQKGALGHIMMTALKHGGNKLDAFGGGLQDMYAKFGFEPKAQLPFNDEYAPEGWNYDKLGRPPVVFMKHNGHSPEQVAQSSYEKPDMSKVPVANDYDHAVALQSGQAQPEPTPAPPQPAETPPEPTPQTPQAQAPPTPQPESQPAEQPQQPTPTPQKPAKAKKQPAPKSTADNPTGFAEPDEPAVPGMSDIPSKLRPHLDKAMQIARKSEDQYDFRMNLDRDTLKAMTAANIDPAEFYRANRTPEASKKSRESMQASSFKPQEDNGPNPMEQKLKPKMQSAQGQEFYLYHGTSMPRVDGILKSGFKMNGDYSDFGNAAYFKMPALDTYDKDGQGMLGAPTTGAVVNEFAQTSSGQMKNGAVLKVKLNSDKILDCKHDGRPAELQSLMKGWRSGTALEKQRALLHYDHGHAASDVVKYTPEETLKHLRNALPSLSKQHGDDSAFHGALGGHMNKKSPYELYAKKHGYDAIIDRLDGFSFEGWQVGVYNPKALQVMDVGKSVKGMGKDLQLMKALIMALMKALDDADAGGAKMPPYCLHHMEYDGDGNLHLHVGAIDDDPDDDTDPDDEGDGGDQPQEPTQPSNPMDQLAKSFLTFTKLNLLHGTDKAAAEAIQSDGFRVNGNASDMGNAAYFKSPELDKQEKTPATTARKVAIKYATDTVINAGLDKAANVLDLSDPRNNEIRKVLREAANLHRRHGATTSAYELYAKQNGYDAIIADLPNLPKDGVQVAVYNPDAISVKGTERV